MKQIRVEGGTLVNIVHVSGMSYLNSHIQSLQARGWKSSIMLFDKGNVTIDVRCIHNYLYNEIMHSVNAPLHILIKWI